MEIKLKELVKIKEVMFKMIQNLWDTPLKSYNVYCFYSEFERWFNFYNDERFKVAKTLGEVKEDGSCSVPKEKVNEFNSKIEEILNTDVSMPDLNIEMDDVINSQCVEKSSCYSPVDIYQISKLLDIQRQQNQKDQQNQ